MAQFRTHYDNLQVARNASDLVIRAAYRTLSQKFHPDKNADNPNRAHATMKIINEAYAVLSDPIRKAEHDDWIKRKENEIRGQEKSADQPHYPPGDKDIEQAKASFKKNTEKATATQNVKQPDKGSTSTNESDNGLHFVHVMMLCMVGAWHLTLRSSGAISAGYDKASFFELLFNARFLGMAVAFASVLLGIAIVGWIVGWSLRPWRKYASWVALVLGLGVCVAIWAGGNIQKDQQQEGSAVPASSAALTGAVSAAGIKDKQKQLYDVAVNEIEARHPELNPDLPKYRKDLVEQILRSKEGHEKQQGLAPDIALRTAVAEWEGFAIGGTTSVSPSHSNIKRPVSVQTISDEEREANRCIYKGVMTDDDYRKCGVRPPKNR